MKYILTKIYDKIITMDLEWNIFFKNCKPITKKAPSGALYVGDFWFIF